MIALLLWDPQKIPKLARALAEAKKEYERATATLQEVVEEVQSEAAEGESEEDLDEKIIKTAKELGIETYGKTKDEILRAILAKKAESKPSGEQAAEPAEKQSSENIP